MDVIRFYICFSLPILYTSELVFFPMMLGVVNSDHRHRPGFTAGKKQQIFESFSALSWGWMIVLSCFSFLLKAEISFLQQSELIFIIPVIIPKCIHVSYVTSTQRKAGRTHYKVFFCCCCLLLSLRLCSGL